jgi:hypothetical protein
MPHPKGTRKTPGSGRKPGSRNKTTLQIREVARELIDDPEYLAALRERLLAGTAGSMETLLWHYGYGRPPLESPADGAMPTSITIHF